MDQIQYQGDYYAVWTWSGLSDRIEEQTWRAGSTYKRLLIHGPRLGRWEPPQIAEVGDWLVKGEDGTVRVRVAAEAENAP